MNEARPISKVEQIQGPKNGSRAVSTRTYRYFLRSKINSKPKALPFFELDYSAMRFMVNTTGQLAYEVNGLLSQK